jgi:hypothetical protein
MILIIINNNNKEFMYRRVHIRLNWFGVMENNRNNQMINNKASQV